MVKSGWALALGSWSSGSTPMVMGAHRKLEYALTSVWSLMTESGIPDLASRPGPIRVSMVLLGINIALLVGAWIIAPEAIQSNGGQVLAIVFWSWMAWACFYGHGWCRWVLIIVLVVFWVGVYNSGMAEAWKDSFGHALAEMWNSVDLATIITKLIIVPIVILLYLPDSSQWFRNQKLRRYGLGNETKAET